MKIEPKLRFMTISPSPILLKTKGFNKKLTDDYETNVYDHKKLKNSSNQLIPSIGANPDDGLKIGFVNTLNTILVLRRNPFSSQHTFSGGYYFATDGFELGL